MRTSLLESDTLPVERCTPQFLRENKLLHTTVSTGREAVASARNMKECKTYVPALYFVVFRSGLKKIAIFAPLPATPRLLSTFPQNCTPSPTPLPATPRLLSTFPQNCTPSPTPLLASSPPSHKTAPPPYTSPRLLTTFPQNCTPSPTPLPATPRLLSTFPQNCTPSPTPLLASSPPSHKTAPPPLHLSSPPLHLPTKLHPLPHTSSCSTHVSAYLLLLFSSLQISVPSYKAPYRLQSTDEL
ncbi:hypothetical protein ACOMHN_062219 [Nucella lapillus]